VRDWKKKKAQEKGSEEGTDFLPRARSVVGYTDRLASTHGWLFLFEEVGNVWSQIGRQGDINDGSRRGGGGGKRRCVRAGVEGPSTPGEPLFSKKKFDRGGESL